MSLRLANDIRAYVAAVSARNAEVADPVSDADMTAWSLWALAQADRVDPVLARVFLQPVSEEDAEEDGSESTQPGNGCASKITTPALPTSAWHPNRVRKRGVVGKRGSTRLKLGGPRIIK